MKKTIPFLKNQAGVGLVHVIILVGAISAAGVYTQQKNQFTNKATTRQFFKQNEKAVGGDILAYFSDRNNCKKYFDNITYTGDPDSLTMNTADEDLELLTNNLKDDEKISSGSFNFLLSSFNEVGELSTSPDGNIKRVSANLGLRLEGKNSAEGLKTSEESPRLIPLVFEFSKTLSDDWQFYSCYAQDSENFTAQASCKLMGGHYVSESNDCKYGVKGVETTIDSDGNEQSNIVYNYTHSLQDAFCAIEQSAARQPQVAHAEINDNNSGSGVQSKFCPAPVHNGCVTSNGTKKPANSSPYSNGIVHTAYPEGVTELLNKYLTLGQNQRYKRLLGRLYVSKGENEIFKGDHNNTDFQSSGGNYELAAFAVGSAGIIGGALATGLLGATLGPAGLVGAIAVTQVFKCGKKRKVIPKFQCVDGEEQVHSLVIEKEKRILKRWGWKCRYRYERTFHPPSENTILQRIYDHKNNITTQEKQLGGNDNSDAQKDLEANNGVENIPPAEFLAGTKAQAEEVFNGNIQFTQTDDDGNETSHTVDSIDSLYAYFSTFDTKAEDGSITNFEYLKSAPIDPKLNPSEAASTKASIDEGVDALKDLFAAKEEAQWAAFTVKINALTSNLASRDATIAKLKNYCKTYNTKKYSIQYSSQESPLPSKASGEAIESKKLSLYSGFVAKRLTILNAAEAALAASAPDNTPAEIKTRDDAQIAYDTEVASSTETYCD